MNIKDHHHLQAIALHPTQQNWKCLHIRHCQYTEFHISNSAGVVSPLEENLNFFSPLGFDFETKRKKSSSTQSEL